MGFELDLLKGMGKGLLGSGVTCLLSLGETDVVDCGLIHAERNQPQGRNLGAQVEPNLGPILFPFPI